MTKSNATFKRILCFICIALLTCIFAVALFCGNAQAQTVAEKEVEGAGGPQRLFANVALSLNGGNGYVWVTAKTHSNLFSHIRVTVELYCSDTYCQSYMQMKFVGKNTIEHLGLGKSIEYKASTNGKEMYWMGRLVCQIDNNEPETRCTPLCLYSANGDFLQAF